MMTQTMTDTFNEQINRELYSAYLYTSMEHWFMKKGLKGFANWFKVQAGEELNHARKIMDYINERGGRIRLKAISMPDSDWQNILSVFENSLSHEEYVTSEISRISELAEEEKDKASEIFLEWFITEQIEEESSINNIIDALRMIGNSVVATFDLDRELLNRS